MFYVRCVPMPKSCWSPGFCFLLAPVFFLTATQGALWTNTSQKKIPEKWTRRATCIRGPLVRRLYELREHYVCVHLHAAAPGPVMHTGFATTASSCCCGGCFTCDACLSPSWPIHAHLPPCKWESRLASSLNSSLCMSLLLNGCLVKMGR